MSYREEAIDYVYRKLNIAVNPQGGFVADVIDALLTNPGLLYELSRDADEAQNPDPLPARITWPSLGAVSITVRPSGQSPELIYGDS